MSCTTVASSDLGLCAGPGGAGAGRVGPARADDRAAGAGGADGGALLPVAATGTGVLRDGRRHRRVYAGALRTAADAGRAAVPRRARGHAHRLRLQPGDARAPAGGAGAGAPVGLVRLRGGRFGRSEEHTSELQSLMRISYAVFCLKKKIT